MIWLLLACTEETPTYNDITSRDEVDVVEEPSSEPASETGVEDTADTATIEDTVDEMTFRAPFMTCTEVQKRTLTLTRMMPGSLSVDGVSGAQFYNEVSGFSWVVRSWNSHRHLVWMIVYFR